MFAILAVIELVVSDDVVNAFVANVVSVTPVKIPCVPRIVPFTSSVTPGVLQFIPTLLVDERIAKLQLLK
jgi:hypothetical protein